MLVACLVVLQESKARPAQEQGFEYERLAGGSVGPLQQLVHLRQHPVPPTSPRSGTPCGERAAGVRRRGEDHVGVGALQEVQRCSLKSMPSGRAESGYKVLRSYMT